MQKLTYFLIFAWYFFSCGLEPKTPEAIFGNWRGVSWTVENKEVGKDASRVQFQFDGNNYSATIGGHQEQGTFRVEGDKLYTTAEGQQQIMVKIVRLATDTFEMEMNRGGTKENLVLKKE